MKTSFNGFDAAITAVVTNEPMESLYRGDRERPESDNVVNLR